MRGTRDTRRDEGHEEGLVSRASRFAIVRPFCPNLTKLGRRTIFVRLGLFAFVCARLTSFDSSPKMADVYTRGELQLAIILALDNCYGIGQRSFRFVSFRSRVNLFDQVCRHSDNLASVLFAGRLEGCSLSVLLEISLKFPFFSVHRTRYRNVHARVSSFISWKVVHFPYL